MDMAKAEGSIGVPGNGILLCSVQQRSHSHDRRKLQIMRSSLVPVIKLDDGGEQGFRSRSHIWKAVEPSHAQLHEKSFVSFGTTNVCHQGNFPYC